MDPITYPVDAARLYDDLRSFIRANDQQGVRSALGELNRAGRPIAEVLAVVRSLSRTGDRQKPQGVGSSPNDSEPCAPPSRPAVGVLDLRYQAPTHSEPGCWSEGSSNDDAAAPRSVLAECPESNPAAGAQSTADLASQIADDQRACSGAVLTDWEAIGAVTNSDPESDKLSICGSPDRSAVRLFDRGGAEVAPVYGTQEPGSADIGLLGEGRSADTVLLRLRRWFYVCLVASIAATGLGVPLLFQPSVADISAGIMRRIDEASSRGTEPSMSAADASGQAGGAVTRSSERSSDVFGIVNTAALALPESRPDIEGPLLALTQMEQTNQAAQTPDPAWAAFSALRPALPDGTVPDQRADKYVVAASEAPSKKAGRNSAAGTAVSESPSPPPKTAPALPVGSSANQPDATLVVGSSGPLGSRSETTVAAPAEITPAPAPADDQPALEVTPSTVAPVFAALAATESESKLAIASLEPAKNADSSSREPPGRAVETSFLVQRGDQLFGRGEITSARLFYERAAEAGDGQAALRLGETFDPAFLQSIHVRSMRGDLPAAMYWYRRAGELGASGAYILIKSMPARQDQ